jgi:Ni,Fe-hydrogenase III small subunit/NAD-dependent dihydropyrimidine dehydrogenase PreA subunit
MLNILKKNLSGPTANWDALGMIQEQLTKGGRRLRIDAAACTRCGACAAACPTGALVLVREERQFYADAAGCIACGRCAEACPAQALTYDATDIAAAAQRKELQYLPTEQVIEERLAKALKKGRSLHLRHVDCGSCNGCDWELTALNNPRYDIQRYGIDFVASPRHADAIMVTGPVSRHLEQALLRTLDSVPQPRRVIAVGTCACGGGIFGGTYATHHGVPDLLDVDVFIPGCPPRPLALIHGLLLAKEV